MLVSSAASRMSLRLTAVLAVGASLLLAAPAGAAPTWLAPSKLSAAGRSAETPQVSVDAQGDALAVWARVDEGSGLTVIEASGRPAGSGSWQSPVKLSDPMLQGTVPEVALDSSGDAVATWLSYDGSEYSIDAATRPGLNGAWQSPVTLKTVGMSLMEPAGPDLAVDPAGEAVVVWPRAEKTIEASTKPAGGSFQTPETLSSGAEAQHPAEVAIDAAGEATAVWEGKSGGDVLTTAAIKSAGGKWQAAKALSAPGGNANEPRVAMNARGDAVAIWERFEGEEIIEAASKPASSSTWGAPTGLTKPETGKGEPAGQQVAIDASGDLVGVWSRTDASHDIVEATDGHVSRASWTAPVAVSGLGGNVEEAPEVSVNGAGNAVVVWERLSGTSEVIEAASGLAASGSWQAPVALSANGNQAAEAQVAVDAQGNAAATWKRFDGTSYIAEATGFAFAGPLLSPPSIPATGTVGKSLSFSTSASDVWSAPGTPSWSFGDGTSQAGGNTAHAYGSPGTYTVTVSSTDAVGNTTSASGTVRIAAAGVVVPTPLSPPHVSKPVIGRARLTHSRFRVASAATAIAAKAPRGTTFSFTLSAAAKLRITFTRSAPGLRSGRRCAAPSAKLRRRHAKHCVRTLIAGTLTRANERARANSLPFSGRIGTKPLSVGAYKAILVASVGGSSSAPTTLSFAIVR
jgi:hypothetical protein